MSAWRIAGLIVAAAALSGQAAPPRYAAGQVWVYRTRPQDAGSLLKIQRIAALGSRSVYHISVVGVHFATPGVSGTLPHIPVSDITLDASTLKLSPVHTDFPPVPVDDGIARWQKAKGGVFTIPLSQIVDMIDDQTGRKPKPARSQPPIP